MVRMADILALSNAIARRYRPERIILFGSHAYGRPHKDSDVDLMLIMPYSGNESDRAVDILMKTNPRFAVDLLLYRPGEIRRRYREFDPLVREALDKGKVLYERDSARVGGQRRRRLRHGKRAAAGRHRRRLPANLRVQSSDFRSNTAPRSSPSAGWSGQALMAWSRRSRCRSARCSTASRGQGRPGP